MLLIETYESDLLLEELLLLWADTFDLLIRPTYEAWDELDILKLPERER